MNEQALASARSAAGRGVGALDSAGAAAQSHLAAGDAHQCLCAGRVGAAGGRSGLAVAGCAGAAVGFAAGAAGARSHPAGGAADPSSLRPCERGRRSFRARSGCRCGRIPTPSGALSNQPELTIDERVRDGDLLPFGPRGLRVLHTPGHAPGHVCLWDEAGGGLVAGDMVASQGTIIVSPQDEGDMALYLASLRLLCWRGVRSGSGRRMASPSRKATSCWVAICNTGCCGKKKWCAPFRPERPPCRPCCRSPTTTPRLPCIRWLAESLLAQPTGPRHHGPRRVIIRRNHPQSQPTACASRRRLRRRHRRRGLLRCRR
jgi:hypothetical protein